MIVLAVVWRISWKGARGEAGCLIRRLLKILEVARMEQMVAALSLALRELCLMVCGACYDWLIRAGLITEQERETYVPVRIPLPPPVTGVTRQFKNTVHICIGSFPFQSKDIQ